MSARRKGSRRRSPAGRAVILVDVPEGMTLEEMEELNGEMFDSVAESSGDVYGKHLKYFRVWLAARGVAMSSVETGHVAYYVREMGEKRGRSVSWMYCALAAVKKALEWEGHLDRVDWAFVLKKLNEYRNRTRVAPAGVDGITMEFFEMIEAETRRPRSGEWAEKTARRAAFDLALIALMRDCLLRRGEAAAVKWGDIKIERTPRHVYGVLTIPSGKTDRFGNREVGYLHVSTMARLQEMAKLCGRDPTKADELVFGIGEKQVANRIKAACEHAGLPGRFCGHSPRVGMAMDLAIYNTPLVGIMQSGRWRLPRTVMKYIKSIAAGDNAVARLHRAWERGVKPRPRAWSEVL